MKTIIKRLFCTFRICIVLKYCFLILITAEASLVRASGISTAVIEQPFGKNGKNNGIDEVLIVQSNQTRIKGVVTDEKGDVIIGANLIEKGTTNGTITDVDGKFEMQVSTGSILLISYIGYSSKEISILNQKDITIVLHQNAENIDDIVVVGYGTQRKGSITGSIAAIKGDAISKVATSNVGSALAGRLPGLIAYNRAGEPGSDNANLSIRGFGGPLIIVDGVEVRDFQKIDPNDIESLSILKDASASIYGARAGNGVMLITSKRGKEGVTTLSFNSIFSWQSSIRPIKLVDVNDFITLWNEASDNSGKPENKYTQKEIDKYKTEGGTNWYDETFKKQAPMQQYNLNISGGTKKMKYFIATGYMHQTGLLRSNDQQINRFNLRSNLDIQVLDNLSVSLDISGVWNKSELPALSMWDTFANMFIARPTDPARWPDPNYVPKSTYHGEWASTVYSTSIDYRGYKRNSDLSVLPSVTIKYDFKFVPGLSAKAFYNYRIDNIYEKQFDKSFAIYDYNKDTQVYTKQREYPAGLREEYWSDLKSSPQLSLSYNKTFDQKHDFSALALFEYNVYYNHNFKAERQGFLSNEIEQLSAGDPTSQTNQGSEGEAGRASWIGRVNYAYKQKYLIEALLRYDGSAKFAKDNRWGAFPGVSLGWRISEESFLKNKKSLDNLKLRASYGMAGNDNGGGYDFLNGYKQSRKFVFGENQTVNDGIETRGLSNPNITWEKTETYNIGVDFSLWNRGLYGEIDAFYRNVSDVFGNLSQSLPSTFGASLPQMNINDYSDRGFELMLGHIGSYRNIQYDIEGNVSWTRSKWGHYDEPVYTDQNEKNRLKKSGNWRNRWLGYRSNGLFKSQEEINAWPVDQDGQKNATISPGDIRFFDHDGDNKLTDKDRVEIGRSDVPEIVFGLKIDLAYKGFYFNMLWQGAGNVNTMYSADLRRPFIDTATPHIGFLNRFHQVNNPNGTWPRMSFDNSSNNDKDSDFWIRNASYLRLKNIELGYTLPNHFFSNLKINSIRLFLSATNILTIDNVDTIDPEVGAGDRGWRYPTQKTMSFGLGFKL